MEDDGKPHEESHGSHGHGHHHEHEVGEAGLSGEFWFELFYDLIFVAAVFKLGGKLKDGGLNSANFFGARPSPCFRV